MQAPNRILAFYRVQKSLMQQPLICINPSEISEGDLLSYVDGQAPAAVLAHVHMCPACALEAARLRSFQAALRVKLDRRNCPAPDLLGDLAANLLTGGKKLVVARHVQQCPTCAQELERYSQPLLPSAGSGLLARATSAIRRVTTALRQTPDPGLVPVRGPGASNQFFHTENLDLLVGYTPGIGVGGHLMGVLLPRQRPRAEGRGLPAAEIVLAQDVTWRGAVEASNLGHFVIERVTPGVYDLLVHWQDELVWFETIIASTEES